MSNYTKFKSLNLILIFGLSLIYSLNVLADTTVFCPAHNTVPIVQSFWRCLDNPNRCDGKSNFIGATTTPEADGSVRYFCAYDGDIKGSFISTKTFLPPKASDFKGQWQFKDNRMLCISKDPNACPIQDVFGSVTQFKPHNATPKPSLWSTISASWQAFATQHKKILDLLILIFFDAILGYICISSIFKWKKIKQLPYWHMVEGKIIRSKERRSASRSGVTYYLDIAYEYQVANKTYQNNVVYLAIMGPMSTLPGMKSDDADAYIEKYSLNAIVKVYYNPLKPEEAVLETNHEYDYQDYLMSGIIWLFFFSLTFSIFTQI